MSIVRITNHNENIYDIKGERIIATTKPPRYTSIYRSQAEEELKKEKKDHRTFGLPEVPLKKPTDFLKKCSRRIPPRPIIDKPRCLINHRPPLPPLPRPVKKPSSDLEQAPSEKNFCVDNVVQAIRLVPPQPERYFADTRAGDLQQLDSSGLVPKFSLKKCYGKLPKYLTKRLKEMEEKQRKERNNKERDNSNLRYIPQEEREDLLNGMKTNFHELMSMYNTLPVFIDTPSKIKRKLKLEADLKLIENDISTVERHPFIYVVDDKEELPSNP